jgi:hypothetical protein
MQKMHPKQAESNGILMEYRRIKPWIPGVISTPIKILGSCCPDHFVFKLLLSINMWEIFKNESTS